MPYTREHKQQTRQRILLSAMKLFTRQGYDATSIDDVMAHAELTRGAFYAHFDSKQHLYTEAIASAKTFSYLGRPKPDDMTNQEWLGILIGHYLHRKHITDADPPCPLAFLATDVAVREPEIRRTYSKVYMGMNKVIQQVVNETGQTDKDTIMAVTAMMIGGVAIARNLDDGAMRNKLLKSCRETALGLLGI